ncbi:TetR/AcrR family transcriptional regulator [uncultured Corynebacterium sp.]|uniref:TetR/AcrR family transcriptional regulator n=1 Tax=uncultured Corynebacterium sp. TaxID=159447 RepID=UPI0025E9C871|nr:TetR/AcrR family transcriptional regulator [uncultured Corynebacterium sp.]
MPREPQQDRSRETRRRLLDAALATLTDHGLTATTVSGVAQRAGVSRGAAQHHFPTRDALVEATIDEFFAERTHQLRNAVAALRPGAEGASVTEVLDLVFGFFSDSLFHAAVQVWAGAASDAQLKAVILPAEERYSREVYQLAALALNADLSDRRTRRMLSMTLDIARGLGLASVLIDDSGHRDEVVETWGTTLSGAIRRNG